MAAKVSVDTLKRLKEPGRPTTLTTYWELGRGASRLCRRKRDPMTQAALAKELNVGQTTLGRAIKFAQRVKDRGTVAALDKQGVPWRAIIKWLGVEYALDRARILRNMLRGLNNSTKIAAAVRAARKRRGKPGRDTPTPRVYRDMRRTLDKWQEQVQTALDVFVMLPEALKRQLYKVTDTDIHNSKKKIARLRETMKALVKAVNDADPYLLCAGLRPPQPLRARRDRAVVVGHYADGEAKHKVMDEPIDPMHPALLGGVSPRERESMLDACRYFQMEYRRRLKKDRKLGINHLFSDSKDKIGLRPKTQSWSIPMATSCRKRNAARVMIATPFCARLCFGNEYKKYKKNILPKLNRNEKLRQREDFWEIMIGALVDSETELVRVHGIGDFDDAYYIYQWHEIARHCHLIEFFAYTRAWRWPSLIEPLTELAALPNFSLILSYDETCKIPPPPIRYTRTSPLLNKQDGPPTLMPRDVIAFRSNFSRRRAHPLDKVTDGRRKTKICPHQTGAHPELGAGPASCYDCRWCLIAEKRRTKLAKSGRHSAAQS